MKYIGNYKDLIPKDDVNDIELPPLPETRQSSSWVISTFEPGRYELTHKDSFISNSPNPVKYIMFLTDWEIGHIFTYNSSMRADYKAGDLYELDKDPEVIYSCANIGYTTSSMLEIRLCDGDQL